MMMYESHNVLNHCKLERVIVFGGMLTGKMAVYESEEEFWGNAFELARALGIEVARGYGYTGSVMQ